MLFFWVCSVQFSLLFQRTKKRHTGDNSERAELTKSTATTIATNKIGVSIDDWTLTQKSQEKVGERKHTLYKYIQLYTLFSNHTVVQPVIIFGAYKFFYSSKRLQNNKLRNQFAD